MKTSFLIFLSLIITSSAFSQLQLFEPQNLSNEYGPSKEHSIVADGNQYYLAWNQWGDIMFRRSENGGINWGNKITIYTGFDYGANYPVVAASEGNVYIAYYRNTGGNSQVFLVRSTNNGQTFGNEIQVTNAIRGAQVPQIVASGDTVVVAYEDRDLDYKYQVFVTISTNAGQTWSTPVNLSNTTSGARWCNIAMKNNSLFVLWNNQTGTSYDHLDLFFTKSENFGLSWTTPENISNNQAYNARLKTKVIDNSIYVVVSSKVDPLQTDIILYSSHNLGNDWQPSVNLSNNTGESARPDIWLEQNTPGNHRIYIVWSDDTYSGNDKGYLKYSLDHGYSWSQMMQFSQDTEDASWPQIVGFHEGSADKLFLAWYRPNDGTFNYEVWGRRAENTLSAMVTLSGQITSTEGPPIDGATISLNGFLTFSMENGQYSVEVPAGMYHLSVVASNYQSYVDPQLELIENTMLNISLSPLTEGNYPPHNLHAQLQDVNNIFLNWEEPIGFNSSELLYDDGESNGLFWVGTATGNEMMAVAFQHEEPIVLRQLKLFTSAGSPNEQVLLHVFGDQGGMPDGNILLGGPYLIDIDDIWTKAAVDIPIPANVRFYIVCQWNNGNNYRIGGDLNQPDGFSYSTSNGGALWHIHDEMDFMIRAGIATEGKNNLKELLPLNRTSELLGYKTYLDGIQFGDVSTELYSTLTDVAVGEMHQVSVSAVYTDGDSPLATAQINIPEPLLFPALNLVGEMIGSDNTVMLSWDDPASDGTWLQWDDGVNTDAVGGSNIEIFDAAIRFTPEDLIEYNGQYLTKIAAFFAAADCQIFLRVWQGGNQNYAGDLIREQMVAYPIINEWNTLELETPIQIDASQELWFGYRVINTGGVFPAGTDNGPATPFKGDMLLYGSDWVSMSSYFGWDINWNIKGLVVDAGQKEQMMANNPLSNTTPFSTGTPEKTTFNKPSVPFSWTYTHFNIYRNDEVIGTAPAGSNSFEDQLPFPAMFTYFVTTAWDTFESVPSNEVVFFTQGLSQNEEDNNILHIYPNPITGGNIFLEIDLEKASQIKIKLINPIGKTTVVLEDVYFNNGIHTIDLSSFIPKEYANGFYVVQLQTDTGFYNRKFILSK